MDEVIETEAGKYYHIPLAYDIGINSKLCMRRTAYALNTTGEEHAAVAATAYEHQQVADASSTEWLTDEICQQILHMLQSPEDDDSRKFRLVNRKSCLREASSINLTSAWVKSTTTMFSAA